MDRGWTKAILFGLAGAFFLAVPGPLPAGSLVARRSHSSSSAEEQATLARYARDTWQSFVVLAQPGGLPADSLCRDRGGAWTPTEPYFADEHRRLSLEHAGRRGPEVDHAGRSPAAPRGDARHAGPAGALPWLLFQLVRCPDRLPADDLAGGWQAAASFPLDGRQRLAGGRPDHDPQHPPGAATRAEALLEPMDFRFFYAAYDPGDPIKHPGLLHLGYWTDDGSFAGTYGMVNTEPRIASYIGIARARFRPSTTTGSRRTRQPHGVRRSRSRRARPGPTWASPVFEGHYTYRGMRIVPSWGGSMFEALMVPLFVPEARWAPRSWGVNHPLYVRAQIEHGLEEARYGFWGFSPACRPEGGYRHLRRRRPRRRPRGLHLQRCDVPAGAGTSGVHRRRRDPARLVPGPAVRPARGAWPTCAALAEKFPIYGPTDSTIR